MLHFCILTQILVDISAELILPMVDDVLLLRQAQSPRTANLVAQCSATPASVAATPRCSATPLQRQLDVRHSWPFKGDRCDRAFEGGGCSAILLLHLKNPRILRKSAARRVARHMWHDRGSPHTCATMTAKCKPTSGPMTQKHSRRLWRSRRRKTRSEAEGGADFPAAIFLAGEAQTLARIACRATGKWVNNFSAASKFTGKLFQQGISESHGLLGFSECQLISAGTWELENHRKAAEKRHFLATQLFQCCSAVFRLLQQLLVKTTSALQKSKCCSAVSAAQLLNNCSATSAFVCGLLQWWGLEGWVLFSAFQGKVPRNVLRRLPRKCPRKRPVKVSFHIFCFHIFPVSQGPKS